MELKPMKLEPTESKKKSQVESEVGKTNNMDDSDVAEDEAFKNPKNQTSSVKRIVAVDVVEVVAKVLNEFWRRSLQ